MGNLSNFNLKKYIDKYNSTVMVETGTWMGAAVEYALKFNLDIYTIELLEKYYKICSDKFKNNKNVVLIHDDSINGLKIILTENEVGNTIFWLDAHLPNFYDNSYGNKTDADYKTKKNILIPLEDELKIIVNNKNIKNDVFIIDDLRIYEKGSFKKGEWNGVINAGYYGIDFVFDLLKDTHNIERIYDDEGYILCTPK